MAVREAFQSSSSTIHQRRKGRTRGTYADRNCDTTSVLRGAAPDRSAIRQPLCTNTALRAQGPRQISIASSDGCAGIGRAYHPFVKRTSKHSANAYHASWCTTATWVRETCRTRKT